MSWSTLTLGRVHRNQICTNTKNKPLIKNQKICMTGEFKNGIKSPNGDCQPPKNNVVIIPETANICAYSAKKNIANIIPEYSR